ncbi:MAG TPA: hypothetical protein DEB31_01780 [Clostridiales bacterium]|nr:hypothetical protein [Clostridiales bacterium]
MPGGYDAIYEHLTTRLSACDFAEISGRLGLSLSGDTLAIRFLARDYVIDRQGVAAQDDAPVPVNTKNVLLYYVLSPGVGRPKNEFVPFQSLYGTLEARNAQQKAIMSDPLVRAFGQNYALFAKAAVLLGGTCIEDAPGKHEWRFTLLPKIPFKVVFYEQDSEFPPEVQLFYDVTAPYFLEFECLAFLTGSFSTAMVNTARSVYCD